MCLMKNNSPEEGSFWWVGYDFHGSEDALSRGPLRDFELFGMDFVMYSAVLEVLLIISLPKTRSDRLIPNSASHNPSKKEAWQPMVLRNLVTQQLRTCNIVLTGNFNSRLYDQMLSRVETPYSVPVVSLRFHENEDAIMNYSQDFLKIISQNFPLRNCMAIICEITDEISLKYILRFFEIVNLRRDPRIIVIFLGASVNLNLISSSIHLSNSIHLFYITEKDRLLDNSKSSGILVYKKCMICSRKQKFVLHDRLTEKDDYSFSKKMFQVIPNDFRGHVLEFLALEWPPFISLQRLTNESCSEAILKDALNTRIITEISKHLNFRFKISLPCDGVWGTLDENGNWSGIVGALQHEKADGALLVSLYFSRLDIVDYTRSYILEPLIFVARKPGPLPRSMSLVRPFKAVTWVVLLISFFVASAIFILLQKISSEIQNNKNYFIKIGECIFRTFYVFVNNPSSKSTITSTSKTFLSFWYVFCMVVALSYQSSLIAHLTSPGKMPAINTVKQLLDNRNSWTWGMEPLYGSGWMWFLDNKNQDFKTFMKDIQISGKQDQMTKVLHGNHAFFTYKYYIESFIKKNFTDSRGFIPIYISQEKYLNYGGYSWGFRKGSPFQFHIDRFLHRLLESGFINFWMQELSRGSINEKSFKKAKKSERPKNMHHSKFKTSEKTSEGVVILSLEHLQGAFYLYIIGIILSVTSFLNEIILSRFQKSK